MFEYSDFMLVLAKPELYDDCRGFSGVGMPHCRIKGSRSQGILHALGLGWVASCLFCETPGRAGS